MKTRHILTRALLWAVAIVGAAAVSAPAMLWLILLPVLAAIAPLTTNALRHGCATS